MAQVTTSRMCFTPVQCSLRQIAMPWMPAQYLAETVCAPRFVTALVLTALRNMSGIVAICMDSAFTLRTWHRKAIGIAHSQRSGMDVRFFG